MKFLKILIMLMLFSNIVFAKSHEGSFKFMDFRKSVNTFNTTIEVKYSIDILMGEPLVKAKAKYEIMGLVNIDGKNLDISKEQLDKLKIYNLKIRVPFESKTVHRLLWIEIDMGAMGKQGEWSYNTPESPNWSKWIIGEGGYLSKEDAIKAYKGFQRLGMNDGLGSLATAITIEFDVSGAKKKVEKKKVLKNIWIDKMTGLMWQDEKYTKREIDNYKQSYKKQKNIGKTGDWYHAEKYCQNLILNDFGNWRLPSVSELNGIKSQQEKIQYSYLGATWALDGKENKKYIFSFYDYKKEKKSIWLVKKDLVWIIQCVRSMK